VVSTVIPVATPGWGAPVCNVLAPKVRVIAEAVVEAPPVTTLMVPKPGVDPEAAVLETSMVPTVTLEHVVAQVIKQGLLRSYLSPSVVPGEVTIAALVVVVNVNPVTGEPVMAETLYWFPETYKLMLPVPELVRVIVTIRPTAKLEGQEPTHVNAPSVLAIVAAEIEPVSPAQLIGVCVF
jgi:hypothetical protein